MVSQINRIGRSSISKKSPAVKGVLIALALLFGWSASAEAEATSRAEQIHEARRKKKAEAAPDALSKAERRMNRLMPANRAQRLTIGYEGVNLVWGGLPTAQGFALGPSYVRRDLLNGNLHAGVSARASTGRALLLDARATLPRFANRRMYADFYFAHRNSPRLEYFGRGPDSVEEDRSHFRLESNEFDMTYALTPFEYRGSRPLRFGVVGGVYWANPGPGNRSNRFQIPEIFPPGAVPGLDAQTTFLRGGVFAEYDWRDFPGEPRRGGYYRAKFVYYDDRDLNRHDFRRLELEAQQFFSFFADRRVFAFRVRTDYTFENGTTPFYLQPVVGGAYTLRGFRAYRFYDDNAIVANAEYRFEAFTGLDMALFFDAGKVAPRRAEIDFSDLEASAGFGFRFNIKNNVFMRFDVGFSHEGARLWLTFDGPF